MFINWFSHINFVLIPFLCFSYRYCSMTYIVDQLFPPLREDDGEEPAIEYSNFNYWRDPISSVDLLVKDSELLNLVNTATSKSLASIPEN